MRQYLLCAAGCERSVRATRGRCGFFQDVNVFGNGRSMRLRSGLELLLRVLRAARAGCA